ncbi:MAG: OmpA family protein [Terracidiphilus sp.]|jgi:outer membrane protein OmpA-like peptidoglycan-associated protein
MRLNVLLLTTLLLLSAPVGLVAQDDAEGCKDSPLLTRLSGCVIAYCSKSDFDAAELQISLNKDPRTSHVEGKIEKIHYRCSGKSALQVRRNAEQALRAAGYALDFTGYDVPEHYVTAHKGAQWVAVVASEMTGDSEYNVITVLTEAMQQEMTSDASAWAAEINKTGHAAVYGIEFDTGKATLKPQSEKVLGDVLSLLQAQPDWKMKIEGHTDSTGTKAGNLTLSQQRAAAVVAWLTQNGIARSRLTTAGLGDTKPIADNSTEQGRARNRRVELVKQ